MQQTSSNYHLPAVEILREFPLPKDKKFLKTTKFSKEKIKEFPQDDYFSAWTIPQKLA